MKQECTLWYESPTGETKIYLGYLTRWERFSLWLSKLYNHLGTEWYDLS